MDNKINKSIDISVIIPVFNRENTIQNCINSVLNQTFLPFEIIIVNDGSNDKTVSKVKELNNSLIKIIHNEDNRGAQHARNQGIKSAKYKWITFLDSDDLWDPLKLEKQVDIIKANNHDPLLVINSKCKRRFESTNKTEIWELPVIKGSPEKIYKELLVNPGPMFQGMLTSKYALEKIDYLDESIVSYQEWDTSIRLSKICSFIWINKPLFIYNIPSRETTFRKKDIWIKGYLSIITKNKLEIVNYHGKNKFQKLIYESLKMVGNWNEWELLASIHNNLKNELSRFQNIKILFYKFTRTKPDKLYTLKLIIKKPIIGLKHIVKEKLDL